MAVENAKVLIIVNNWGIEETELTRPLRDLKAAGAAVTLAAATLDPCETVSHDRYEGETLTPERCCQTSTPVITTCWWCPAAPATSTASA